ncbi:740_t:CDS:1 [Scutellospora calospora]|uniref:740_t:CDS:1 n=1 Tax=Scutellospora calospora TaxID=85575 RepID=A0ACA9L3D4_9GLOM|nr:740_t:CDS:1 [Scutellospora calospora]
MDKLKKKEIENATTLHKTNDHKNRIEALKIFQKYKLSYWLGIYHENGYADLEINYEKALKYYQIASLNDIHNSTIKYALLLLKTHKEDKNDEFNLLITTLFEKAADKRNAEGCYHYGDILLNGKFGNESNPYNAYQYLEYAANCGYEKAQEIINNKNIYNSIKK